MTSAYKAEENTPEALNERVRRHTEESIARVTRQGVHAIDARLEELDHEWDVERVLESTASSLALVGIGLAATGSRRWLAMPAIVAGFLLQHALQGWCPPLPVIRAMGFRTRVEIDHERYALKAARGDFRGAEASGMTPLAERLMSAVER